MIPGIKTLPVKKESFLTENNSSLCQIVRRKLQGHSIAWQNTNELQAHLSTDMSEHHVLVLEFHPEHCVGKKFLDNAVNSDDVFYHFVKTSV